MKPLSRLSFCFVAAGFLHALLLAACGGGTGTQDDAGDQGNGCSLILEASGSTELSVGLNEPIALSVVLTDECTGPKAGASIEFAFDGASLGAQLSALVVPTNQEGTATVTLLAGVSPGQVVVVASHSVQVAEVTFQVTIEDPCANHCSNQNMDCGETGVDCGGECTACGDPCAGHCTNEQMDCGETGVDCGGGECAACPDPCDNHCSNNQMDCGETGLDCGGECAACPDPCENHCTNGQMDCGETGLDCGGACTACPDPCENHCSNGAFDCGETGVDCGGECAACTGTDDAAAQGNTLPIQMACQSTTTANVTMQNTGTTTWFRNDPDGYKLGYVGDDTHPFLPGTGQTRVLLGDGQTVAPGGSVTFHVTLRAPEAPATYTASFRMLLEGVHWFGQTVSQSITVTDGCQQTGCTFPQGVPDGDYTHGDDTDSTIANAVNAVMASLSGCNPGSDCPIGGQYPTGQSWFDAVNQELRNQGFCAGQHEEGYTDEIAVSNTGCTGRWYGYHIYNYGGSKVVWNPGAQRGWWSIDPQWCE